MLDSLFFPGLESIYGKRHATNGWHGKNRYGGILAWKLNASHLPRIEHVIFGMKALCFAGGSSGNFRDLLKQSFIAVVLKQR